MIRLVVTDFDGTLVDTFEANYRAYERAFGAVGLSLSREQYRACFGFRFDRFMEAMNIRDAAVALRVRELKSVYYPEYFEHIKVNAALLEFIKMFRRCGGKTAVASTARRQNLENALRHINAIDDFDLVLAGEDVAAGKPSPEIYLTVMKRFNISPCETMIFEDSPVGLEAAQASGAGLINVNKWNEAY